MAQVHSAAWTNLRATAEQQQGMAGLVWHYHDENGRSLSACHLSQAEHLMMLGRVAELVHYWAHEEPYIWRQMVALALRLIMALMSGPVFKSWKHHCPAMRLTRTNLMISMVTKSEMGTRYENRIQNVMKRMMT